jgi:hypothetical protein
VTETAHEWWGQLRHDGVLIAPALLDEFFPTLPDLRERDYQRLRDAWLALEARPDEGDSQRTFVEAVVRGLCDLVGWQKGPQVEDRFKATSPTGQRLRPDWVLIEGSGDAAALAVAFDQIDRLGIGRGKRAYARLVELLRATGIPLGLLTNGRQLRLVHAGPDYAAWAEWDASAWFDEAEGRNQLRGLRVLLGHGSLTSPPEGQGLVAAIQASRHRQGDLAQVLGEQVRQAVEHVIDAIDTGLSRDPDLLRQVHKDPRSGQDIGDQAVLAAIYQAATRVVMRLVVLLYAEARELLPRSNETYHRSYGVEGLYHQLTAAQRHAGGTGPLNERMDAWPRLLALFRVVHEGSPHQDLPIRDYGGTLFRSGDLDAPDPVLRALRVLEQEGTSDAVLLRILRLLKIGRVKVRRGRSSSWVSGPVDFSDLRTEYIGIIYEGLLDFELKRAPDDDSIVFLNLGKQPALPLARLEAMSDKQVKDLIAELRKDKPAAGADASGEDDEPTEDQTDEAAETEESDDLEEGPVDEDEPEATDEELRRRAQQWAERAVEAAGIVRKRGKKSASEHARARAAAGAKLIERVVGPDRLYLATWGGLRKGTGTFYTRPALAVPTTQRTLELLCYDRTDHGLIPKAPEEILELKVCDPAMGSGSFLVAALRYLTEALANSLVFHERIGERDDKATVTLPLGQQAQGDPHEELLPVRREDDRFDSLLRARLARHVVERCIYGVDINPMAVELARLALWVETLDRELPFEFLDHKLKVGNALIGCWVHLTLDYPAKAWEREAGDGKSGDQTKWLTQTYRETVKPELKELLERRLGTLRLPGMADVDEDPLDTFIDLRSELQAIHDLPTRDEREAAYGLFVESEAYQSTKALMDRWCATWFWPTEEDRREPALTPSEWAHPSTVTRATVAEVSEAHGFFHWELEFADAFSPESPGFDAVIGNPPWETVQPESLEFFSNHDPLYRTYNRQRAESRRKELFEHDPGIQHEWLAYESGFKALSHWLKSSEEAFDVSPARGRAGADLKDRWEQDRRERAALAHRDHPFRHQGSGKLYTYKAFLEVAHHLLRQGGRLGFIVPSGLWTDKGATELRQLFLDRSSWEWCYAFENKRKIFPIHGMFKFAAIVVQREDRTQALKAAFMRHDVSEWERPQPPSVDLAVKDIERFSPKTLSFLELKDDADLRISERLYADHPLLGEVCDDLGAHYRQELNMTSDSKYFVSLGKLTGRDLLQSEEDTRDPRVRARLWVAGYAPLYEGKSLWIHDPYYLGKGTSASVSRFVAMDDLGDLLDEDWLEARLAFRDVAASTNMRTLVAGLMPPAPHGNKLPTINGLGDRAPTMAVLLGSIVLDYLIRMKISTTLNWFYVETLPIGTGWNAGAFMRNADNLARRLNALGADFDDPARAPLVDGMSRMSTRLLLDAMVADLYRLEVEDMEHIATRFPIYDKSAAKFAYPRLVPQVYQAFRDGGQAAAQKTAEDLTAERHKAGLGFGLDEVYVPDGGWTKANREAQKILEAG